MHFTAFVTILAAILYVWLGIQVANAHRAFGVALPKTYGNENFERVNRAHMNTVEWAPVFLPLLWLCAYYVSDVFAGVVGLVWIGARVWYLTGYREATEKRFPAFFIQAGACGVLLVGALIGLAWRVFHG